MNNVPGTRSHTNEEQNNQGRGTVRTTPILLGRFWLPGILTLFSQFHKGHHGDSRRKMSDSRLWGPASTSCNWSHLVWKSKVRTLCPMLDLCCLRVFSPENDNLHSFFLGLVWNEFRNGNRKDSPFLAGTTNRDVGGGSWTGTTWFGGNRTGIKGLDLVMEGTSSRSWQMNQSILCVGGPFRSSPTRETCMTNLALCFLITYADWNHLRTSWPISSAISEPRSQSFFFWGGGQSEAPRLSVWSVNVVGFDCSALLAAMYIVNPRTLSRSQCTRDRTEGCHGIVRVLQNLVICQFV